MMTAFFSGCLEFKDTIYLVIEQLIIVKPDMAIACLVGNPKKVMQKGMTIPPPPIPAIVDKEIITISKKRPANSIPKIGKTSL